MNALNERGAGRKPIFTEEMLTELRQRRAQGETTAALAADYGVSRQTISKYLHQTSEPSENIYRTIRKWQEFNRRFHHVETREYMLRLDFMCEEECCTMILADFAKERIEIVNTTDDIIHRAFGIKARPTWEDFELFLEDRCVPRSRDHIRLILKDMGLDFYDPMAIIEKTGGRMAEDHQWIRLAYLDPQAR